MAGRVPKKWPVRRRLLPGENIIRESFKTDGDGRRAGNRIGQRENLGDNTVTKGPHPSSE